MILKEQELFYEALRLANISPKDFTRIAVAAKDWVTADRKEMVDFLAGIKDRPAEIAPFRIPSPASNEATKAA